MRMRARRITPPIVSAWALWTDIVAGAEAAAFGAQQDDARRRISICALESLGERPLQFMVDRIELVRPINSDDADFIVDVVNG